MNPKIVGSVEQRETPTFYGWSKIDGFRYGSIHPSELRRVQGVGVVERAVAAAETGRAGNGLVHIGKSLLDGHFDGKPLSNSRSDRRG
jgi:hypothetical protein